MKDGRWDRAAGQESEFSLLLIMRGVWSIDIVWRVGGEVFVYDPWTSDLSEPSARDS